MGVAEFSLPRLKRLLAKPLVKPPKVDQVNMRDCCSVTSDLTDFVQKHGMDLLVHSDLSSVSFPILSFRTAAKGHHAEHHYNRFASCRHLLDALGSVPTPNARRREAGVSPIHNKMGAQSQPWFIQFPPNLATDFLKWHGSTLCSTNTAAWWRIKGKSTSIGDKPWNLTSSRYIVLAQR